MSTFRSKGNRLKAGDEMEYSPSHGGVYTRSVAGLGTRTIRYI